MNLEDLKNNDYRKNEYWYKRLLRDLKDLDSKLTKYLVNDFYHYEDTDEEDIITEIKSINDITTFILDKIKVEKAENEESYKNYIEGRTSENFEHIGNIHRAWLNMIKLRDKLKDLNKNRNICVNFSKGYDFGLGYSNYCNLTIGYLTKESEHCTRQRNIIGITTTTGKSFRLFKYDDYYKLTFPNDDDVQRTNKRIKEETAFENIEEVVEEVEQIINLLLNKEIKND